MTTLNQAVKSLNQRAATAAALQNELLTRQRVDRLELEVKRLRQTQQEHHDDFTRFVWQRGFVARLRWLFRGE